MRKSCLNCALLGRIERVDDSDKLQITCLDDITFMGHPMDPCDDWTKIEVKQ